VQVLDSLIEYSIWRSFS